MNYDGARRYDEAVVTPGLRELLVSWASKRNGELLALAAGQFDVFLTVDRNLSFQQDIGRFKIAVVVMVAKGNKHADLQPLMADVLAVLGAAKSGQVVRVGA